MSFDRETVASSQIVTCSLLCENLKSPTTITSESCTVSTDLSDKMETNTKVIAKFLQFQRKVQQKFFADISTTVLSKDRQRTSAELQVGIKETLQ